MESSCCRSGWLPYDRRFHQISSPYPSCCLTLPVDLSQGMKAQHCCLAQGIRHTTISGTFSTPLSMSSTFSSGSTMPKSGDTTRKTPSTVSSSSASSSSSSHPYLDQQDIRAIEDWSAHVPAKLSTMPPGPNRRYDPTIQEYLRLKYALFQSVTASDQNRSRASNASSSFPST
ncbi:hypothetical protein K431DRAFT_76764 [Polychaeton citri CBS 116435]|uniref:Uncharacterized protein n=1 Tax=Polychaeton citri CBS 116435 TaxID=1314669 RepID=A0A9P4UPT3_9PEZI|nr:hypothetical protein K431DRAFT_76764 [Polychaeton citri CBS 116435]